MCSNCDEKFTSCRDCKVAQDLVIEIGEPWDEEVDEADKEPQLFLNTISDVAGTKRMRMTGEIHGSQVEALIDSGASLNFINPALARKP